ncbi:hypothetical protein BDR05DRAFT_949337 [Suillus weaverae]|nr:hypothetical protein BDR05DRAFT_949337 [Suillus weaverae]
MSDFAMEAKDVNSLLRDSGDVRRKGPELPTHPNCRGNAIIPPHNSILLTGQPMGHALCPAADDWCEGWSWDQQIGRNRKFNGWMQEFSGRELPLRWSISWVVSARDVGEVEGGTRTEGFEQSEDVSKDAVSGPVSASSVLPTIDHSEIVAMDPEVLTRSGNPKLNDAADK